MGLSPQAARSIGWGLVAVALAVGALGPRDLAVVAWLSAVGLNVLGSTAVLSVVAAPAARRAPLATSIGAATITGLSVLLPGLAPVAAGPFVRAALAFAVVLGGVVVWLERCTAGSARID